MSVDWGAALPAAVLGALSGGLVSFFVAAHVAARQEVGRNRHAARATLRQIVDGARRELGRRERTIGHRPGGAFPEVEWVAATELAASQLSPARGWLVRRRGRKVWGAVAMDVIADHEPGADPEDVMGAVLATAWFRGNPDDGSTTDSDAGLWYTACARTATPRDRRKLQRQLRLLRLAT